MTEQSRRHVLRSIGVLAFGGGLVSGTRGRPGETVDSEAVEWHRTYGTGEFQCHNVVDTPDGVLLLGRTGNGRSATPWLAEVDADGNSAWTTTFDTDGFTRVVDAVTEEDGVTVLVTTDETPAIRLLKLSGDGQELWRRSLAGPEEMPVDGERAYTSNTLTDNAHVLFSLPDGYLVGGYHGHGPHRSGTESSAAWIRAVDTAGETRWNRTYDGTNVADIRPLDGGYLLAGSADGDAWLQAIGTDGEPRWQHTYGGVGVERAAVAIPTTDGIVYGGRSGSTAAGHSRAILVRVTADGEFVWRRERDPQHVRDLLPVGDGFVMTGEPASADHVGRNPEKPVSMVDRWGRVRGTVTIAVDPGAPVGLGAFEDGGVAVGGWDRQGGVWLAKVSFAEQVDD